MISTVSLNNRTVKIYLCIFLFYFNSLYLSLVEQSFYSFLVNVIFTMLVFIFRANRIDYLLAYSIGILFVIIFYEYWINIYGSGYFLGRMSDDWQYDTYWSSGYISKYGFSPFYIREHLNNIENGLGLLHNSIGYVYVIILFRSFGEYFDGYHTLVPRLFNVYLLVLSSSFAIKIIKINLSRDRLKYSVLIYALILFPVIIYTAVHVFRDIVVALLILMYIYYFMIFNASKSKFSIFNLFPILLMFLILVLILTLRSSVSLILILLSMVAVIPKNHIKSVGLIVSPLILFVFFNYLTDYSDEIIRLSSGYDSLNASRFGYVGGQIFELPKWLGFFPRISYLILTPVPSFSSFHQLFTSLSAILQVIFFPILIMSLLNNKIDHVIKIFFLGLFLSIALSTATFRHVVMYIPLSIILIFIQCNYQPFIFSKNYLYKFSLTTAFLFFFIFIALIL